MKNTEYLYGRKSLKGLANMPYKEALEVKINLAESLINSLLKVHYMERDSERINDCKKAIKFNEELIKEMEG